jgi:L-alanine-DL-glutamate epimerase-like enolase superfamily enzyme
VPSKNCARRGSKVMKITRLEAIPVTVPIRERFMLTTTHGVHHSSPYIIVKVHTDEGLVGLGESTGTPTWSGETQWGGKHILDDLIAPTIIGIDPMAIATILQTMERVVKGQPFVKAAVEMACWDITGQAAGLPLCQLLGGTDHDSVHLKFVTSASDPDDASAVATWAVEQGFDTIKIKVGIDPAADIARIRTVREAVGPQVRIGVDANTGWTLHDAITTGRRLEAYDLLFIEQPVGDKNPRWLAQVRAALHTPIVADESVFTLWDALAVVQAEAADVISVYPGKNGGITNTRKIAAVAEAAGLACLVGSNLELGVASAAMLHVALATPVIASERYPCDIIGPLYQADDLLTEPLRIEAGRIYRPAGSGLGVQLDEAKLAHYRVDR